MWTDGIGEAQGPGGVSAPGLNRYVCIYLFILKIPPIHLTARKTTSERGNTRRGSGRGRSRLLVEEPDVGLDPITLESRPEPKADA